MTIAHINWIQSAFAAIGVTAGWALQDTSLRQFWKILQFSDLKFSILQKKQPEFFTPKTMKYFTSVVAQRVTCRDNPLGEYFMSFFCSKLYGRSASQSYSRKLTSEFRDTNAFNYACGSWEEYFGIWTSIIHPGCNLSGVNNIHCAAFPFPCFMLKFKMQTLPIRHIFRVNDALNRYLLWLPFLPCYWHA